MKRKTDADTRAGRLDLLKVKTTAQCLRPLAHAQHAKVTGSVKLIHMADPIVTDLQLQAVG